MCYDDDGAVHARYRTSTQLRHAGRASFKCTSCEIPSWLVARNGKKQAQCCLFFWCYMFRSRPFGPQYQLPYVYVSMRLQCVFTKVLLFHTTHCMMVNNRDVTLQWAL